MILFKVTTRLELPLLLLVKVVVLVLSRSTSSNPLETGTTPDSSFWIIIWVKISNVESDLISGSF